VSVSTVSRNGRLGTASGRARRGLSSSVSLTASFLIAAVVIGAVVTVKPAYAVGLVVAIAIVVLVASRIEALPPLLVLTMYAEGVSFGGVHIGRLVGLFALVAIVYYLLVRGRTDMQASVLLAVGGSYGLWILFSTYWASDQHWVNVSLFRWALAFAYMLAFGLLVRTSSDLRPIMAAFVLAAVVFGIASLGAYVQGGGQRGTGLQGDPNIFAAYQVLAIPPALVLAGLEHRARVRLAYYIAVIFIILSIGASFSRGGLLALAAVVALTVLLPWRLLFSRRGQKLAFLLFLGFAGWLVALLGSTQYLSRIDTILHGSDRGTGRLDLWSAAFRGYSDHPWLGLGAGGFQAHSMDLLRNTPGVAPSSLIDTQQRPVHNAYIETLTDLGPIGLTLFAVILCLTLWYLVSAARSFGQTGDYVAQRLAIGVLISFASILVASIFLSFEFGKSIWIFVGLALALKRMAPAAASDARASPTRTAKRASSPLEAQTGAPAG
jgi:putative inorganic carbon (HCO3(-)) transporter